MLTFNLKKEWYEKIRSGEKTIEYREEKDYWHKRIFYALVRNGTVREHFVDGVRTMEPLAPTYCILRLGYTKRHMTAQIVKVESVDGRDTDLHIDKPVYAIHLANIRERI